jgi:hypothetical protein
MAMAELLQSTTPEEGPPTRRACRVYQRHPCAVPISCKPTSAWTGNERSWSAIIRDVSQGGVRLTLRRRFEPGSGLEVELPGKDGEGYSVIVRVVHVRREEDDLWTLGCKFLSDLSEEEVSTLLPQPAQPTAEPVAPSRPVPAPSPASLEEGTHRQTLSGIHIRLESSAGTVLDCPVRYLNVPANWPPPPGKILTFVALTADGTLPATRVEVIDCTAQGPGWLLRCRLLDAPPAAPPAAPAAPR